MSRGDAQDTLPIRGTGNRAGWYRVLAALSALLIAGLIGVTCIDVMGRYLVNRPLPGAYELTQLLLAALVFAALPLTTADGGHVEVDLALHLFAPRVQRVLGRMAGLVAAAALVFFAWRLVVIGMAQLHDGTRSTSLAIPMAPLAFAAAASCTFSAILLLFRKERS